MTAVSGCTHGGMTKAEAIRGFESSSPDVRRRSIVEMASQGTGRRPPFLDTYKTIAKEDSDELVRATAIRALNIARDASATPIFIAALDDSNTQVKLEAAKALVNLPDADAEPKLRQMLADDQQDKDVRIAVADALRHYRTVDGARALIARLDDRDFGIAWQSRRSLMRLTGKDLRYDAAAWLAFVAGPDRPFG
jgi:HEAT repeat protein